MKKLLSILLLFFTVLFVQGQENFILNGQTKQEVKTKFPDAEFHTDNSSDYYLVYPEGKPYVLAYFFLKEEDECVSTIAMWDIDELPYILYTFESDDEFVKISTYEYVAVSKDYIIRYIIYPDYKSNIAGLQIFVE